MTIVTCTYRYKPPPRRKGRKLAVITGPAVVTVKGSRRPVGVGETAAELEEVCPPGKSGRHQAQHAERKSASASQR